jgi:hypothetical protein
MEIGQGKQIIEFPEHAGLVVQRVTATRHRSVAKSIGTYGLSALRNRRPRQWVPIATVNPGGYLNDRLASVATGMSPPFAMTATHPPIRPSYMRKQ